MQFDLAAESGRRCVAIRGAAREEVSSDEALDEPSKALAALRAQQGITEEEFFVLAIGETRLVPPH